MEKDKPRIISVGAAVRDVFLGGTILTPQYEDGIWVEKFKVGEKYELDSVDFSTGGGATNAAVTFARQGLHASYMGKVGNDPSGRAMLEDLHVDDVDTSLVVTSDERTGYSVVLLTPDGGRTILTYRGASNVFRIEDFNLSDMDGDWLYISSLAGKMEVLEAIVNAANEKNIKIAFNPGKDELANTDYLKSILHKVDILSVNKEELQTLVQGDSDDDLVTSRFRYESNNYHDRWT